MKLISFFIFFLMFTPFLYSQQKAMVMGNNLRVRNNHHISGAIIGNLNYGDIVYIYDKAGSKTINNNIYDYWYKISKTENKWVNSMYINMFPFFCLSAFRQLPDSFMELRINDLIIENNEKYLSMELGYSDDDTSDSYKFFSKLTEKYYFGEGDYIEILDNYTNRIYLLEESIRYNNALIEEVIPKINKRYETPRVVETDKYRVLVNFDRDEILYMELNSADYLFDYNISLGNTYDHIKYFLGEPVNVYENGYKNEYKMNGKKIIFYIINNKVEKIEFTYIDAPEWWTKN